MNTLERGSLCLAVTLGLIAISGSAFAQSWVADAVNTALTTNPAWTRIGIGISPPTAALHVVATSVDFTPDVYGTQIANGVIEITRGSDPYIDFNEGTLGADFDGRIIYNGTNDRFNIDGAGLHVMGTGIDINPDIVGTQIADGAIELTRSSLPYIDFNEGTLGADYDARIIYNNAGSIDRVDVLGADLLANEDLFTTGNAGIGTTSPSAKLHVAGGILSTGETGATPTSGAGSRFMWIPAKQALRAGEVTGTQWNDANIGEESMATGYDNTASGRSSSALGRLNTASGPNTTAMGIQTTASGDNAVSMGSSTTASGHYAVSMGSTNTASGNNSTVMGLNNVAQAYATLVIGRWAAATGNTTTWVGTDPLFVAGNGNGAGNNAAVIYKDGNMTIAGVLTENSDIRLKKEIEPVTDVLSKLESVQPVYYSFIDNQTHPGGHQLGFIAQEIEKNWPELVKMDENGYLSVAYGHMSAIAVQAIKEQQRQIVKLESENDELRARLERLERMIAPPATKELR